MVLSFSPSLVGFLPFMGEWGQVYTFDKAVKSVALTTFLLFSKNEKGKVAYDPALVF